ncbi:MAG: sigma-70 family RNA polymerase sigma factor [Myxococcota bacterium]
MVQASAAQEARGLAETKREEVALLYLRYGAAVLRRCRYLLREDEQAKDAAQEVFVRILRARDQLRSEAVPISWVLKIATNHCLNLLAAKNARWHERFRAAETLRLEVLDAEVDARVERAELVRQLLGKLDAETQAVAIHYYVDEMTQEEIGAALGRSLPTVRKRLEKFLAVAKKELGHG